MLNRLFTSLIIEYIVKTFTSSVPVAQIWKPPNVPQPHSIPESSEEVLDFTTPCLSVPARVAPPTSADLIVLVLQQTVVFCLRQEYMLP